MRDAIVIGAGGGGPVVAKELAARGLDILILEAGARYAHPRKEWTHFEYDANDPVRGFLRWGPADRSKPAWQRELPQSTLLLQASGVGGTTKHYYGNSPRAMPGAFVGHQRRRGEPPYDSKHLFPFQYRSLVPYYEWVEHTLPVQTAAMGHKEEAFLTAAEHAGLKFQRTKDVAHPSYRPQENAILQPHGAAGRTSDPARVRFPEARGCTYCGHCFQGCMLPRAAPRNLFAKRSTDNSYVPMALSADGWAKGGKRATLITDAFVTKIGTDGTSGAKVRARSVTWRVGATGETRTEEARVVVLAGGSIESPRLWLNSGLPNPNGWVGRGLTEHYLDWVIGVMPRAIGASRGPASAARMDFPGRGSIEQTIVTPSAIATLNCFSDSGMWGHYDNGSRVRRQGADAIGRRIGKDLKHVTSDIDRLLAAFVLVDDDVEAHNVVRLAKSLPPDEHGPRPRVEIPFRKRSRRTIANREFLVRKTVEVMRGAGAVHVYRLNTPPMLNHIHSTLRMGERLGDSVLDAGGESRAVKRLFVADNSALANSLGGPNPTLTSQALATRTAEHIFRRYFQGSAWVMHESPVRSTDRRVTQAV